MQVVGKIVSFVALSVILTATGTLITVGIVVLFDGKPDTVGELLGKEIINLRLVDVLSVAFVVSIALMVVSTAWSVKYDYIKKNVNTLNERLTDLGIAVDEKELEQMSTGRIPVPPYERYKQDISKRMEETKERIINARGDDYQPEYYFTAIMLDLEEFSRFNSVSYELGTQALRRIALTLSRSMRRNEFMYKVGGDEFGFLIEDDWFGALGFLKRQDQLLEDLSDAILNEVSEDDARKLLGGGGQSNSRRRLFEFRASFRGVYLLRDRHVATLVDLLNEDLDTLRGNPDCRIRVHWPELGSVFTKLEKEGSPISKSNVERGLTDRLLLDREKQIIRVQKKRPEYAVSLREELERHKQALPRMINHFWQS